MFGEAMEVVLKAKERTAEIRSWIELMADGFERVPGLVIEAHREQDWATLGYPDWESYVRAEFGTGLLRLAVAVRREWVKQLTDAGLSKPEIAPVVNVGTATVARDRDAVAVSNDTGAGFAIVPRLRWQHDGNMVALDVADFRHAVHELASIYPDEIRSTIIAVYERIVCTGLHQFRTSKTLVFRDNFDSFHDEADEKVAAAAKIAGKILTEYQQQNQLEGV